MKNEKIIVITLIALALILKLIFIPVAINKYDLYSLENWSQEIRDNGLVKVYQADTPDYLGEPSYPPGAMYPLALSFGNIYLIKIFYILMDLATGLFLYYIFKKKYSAEKAIWIFIYYLINPMVWINSSLWGASDSWHSFFVLLAIYWLIDKKYLPAGFSIALAISMKPQALIFVPLVFIWIWLDKNFWTSIKSGLVFLGGLIFVSLPWLVSGKIQTVLSIFTNPVGYFTRLSSIAFNLWYFIYGFESIFINDQEKIINLISYRNLSLILFSLVYLGIIIYLIKNKQKDKFFILVWSTCVLAQGFFLLCSEMHERYMFQIIPLAMLLYFYKGWTKYYWYFTFIIFINALGALYLPTIYAQTKTSFEVLNPITRLLALVNLGVMALFIYQGLTHLSPPSSRVKHKS